MTSIIVFCLSILLDDEERNKFTRLFDEYSHPLTNYANSICRSRQLAEEAVQEAFIRVMNNLDKITENDRKRTWCYLSVIVKNVCLTNLSRENRIAMQDMGENDLDDFPSGSPPVWSEYQVKELYNNIFQFIINDLNELERSIFTLRLTRKMSYKEIALATNISEGNVSVKIARTRKRLLQHLLEEEMV